MVLNNDASSKNKMFYEIISLLDIPWSSESDYSDNIYKQE